MDQAVDDLGEEEEVEVEVAEDKIIPITQTIIMAEIIMVITIMLTSTMIIVIIAFTEIAVGTVMEMVNPTVGINRILDFKIRAEGARKICSNQI